MVLYDDDKIMITTIKDSDKEKVLEYFSQNNFNCDYETGALRPTNRQFMQLMEGIIKGEDDENNIFVLKKNSEVIGYMSMFVSYDRLTIGHIAVKKEERKKGYGELLTKLAILVAENEDRDVVLQCNYPNKYLSKLGFVSINGFNYIYKRKGMKTEDLPMFFVSYEEYKKRKEKEIEEETKRFSKFLKSGILDMLD